MGQVLQVPGALLGSVGDELAAAAALARWDAPLGTGGATELGSSAVVDEFTATRGEQQRRAELLVESLTAAGALAAATASETERVEGELEAAAR